MNHKLALILVFAGAVALTFFVDSALAQGPRAGPKAAAELAGTGFTYQGQLKKGGTLVNGNCDFLFGLWAEPATGPQIGMTQTVSSLAVSNGLFSNVLDFDPPFNVFNGAARYLQTSVRCPAGSGSYTPLSPRLTLTPAPMAFALPGLYTLPFSESPNIIGGYRGNIIQRTQIGATISGGGSSESPNQATAGYATVGGGEGNSATGGWSTVDGGENNAAGGLYSAVGGGSQIDAGGHYSAIGGGESNVTIGSYAAIPGGRGNYAYGDYSLVAGRRAMNDNAAHDGVFIFADSSDADFHSTASNQFLVRASGGMGVGTNSPAAQLNISSTGNYNSPQVRIDQMTANDHARLRFNVSGASSPWDIAVGDSTNNTFKFYSGGADIMTLSTGATHISMVDGATESGGNWVNFSDRNAKANFDGVSSREILARVAALPITSWNYRSEDDSIRHIGPMAQDFYAAFKVGADDRHIGTVDEGGVALAAIQGIVQVIEGKDAEIIKLKAESERQQAAIDVLQQQNSALDARLIALEESAGNANPALRGSAAQDSITPAMMLGLGTLATLGFVYYQRKSNRGAR